MRRSISAWAVVAAVLAGGCKKDPIPVLDPDESAGGDFGRAALLEAVDRFRAHPTSAKAYLRLARDIDALRPRFDEHTAQIADRMLTFLAIGPLEANANRDADERIEALAATVWPTVLGPKPKKGEGGHAYLERICAGDLAAECKFVVPEMWGLQLGARVWRRFRERAQDSFAYCRVCQEDDSYRRALARYNETGFAIESEAAKRKGDGHPSHWPKVDAMAERWKDVLTLEIGGGGELRLSGKEVPANRWREVLGQREKGTGAVGLYVRPNSSVGLLRNFVRDLGAIGYREVRLQVRAPAYPYTLGYYRLAPPPARGALDVGVRSTDTVQVAALAMEHALRDSGESGALLDIFARPREAWRGRAQR